MQEKVQRREQQLHCWGVAAADGVYVTGTRPLCQSPLCHPFSQRVLADETLIHVFLEYENTRHQ